MSQQRVCDLDGTIIDPMKDQFYSVVDGRSGRVKDICYQCSRSTLTPITWTASTPLVAGARVKPTTGMAGYVYDVILDGTTGATEPTWPTLVGEVWTDGTVSFQTYPEPNEYVVVHQAMPGTTPGDNTLWGWMTGAVEGV